MLSGEFSQLLEDVEGESIRLWLSAALRTFQSGRDPSQWDAANVNPLPDPTSATSAAAEGKVPQPSAAISRPPYQLRSPNKCRFRDVDEFPLTFSFGFSVIGTQADQDRLDEEVRQQARESLTQSWKDKLSVISLIVRLISSFPPPVPSPCTSISRIIDSRVSC